MSAIHQWSESNGSGEVETIPIANINFGSIDSSELIPTTYPIVRGNASFEKYIRCLFSGSWTEISNIKFWKSLGDYKTDELIKAAANVAYVQPSETPNADSNVPLTEGTALAILSAEGAATIIYGASGVSGYTGYIRLQTRSTVSTPTGVGNQKVFTFQYDET
jgi:hypothetical protein